MKWFRYYSEALNDPKVQTMPDLAFKCWVNLLCLANEGKPRGRFRREDVPYSLRMPEDRAHKMITYFIDRGLLEEDDDFLVPHNWDGRQFVSDNVTERVKKHRSNVSRNVPRNGDEALHGTPPETDTETESETENPPVSPLAGGTPAHSRRKTALPDDWTVSDAGVEYAERHGFDARELPDLVERFRNHHTSRRNLMADWDAAWRTWIDKEPEFRRAGRNVRAAINDTIIRPSAARERSPEEIEEARVRHEARRAEIAEQRAKDDERAIEDARTDPERPPTVSPERWATLLPDTRRQLRVS